MALRLAVGTPGADGLAATREYLHALIVAVGYVQQAVRADGQAPRPTELAAAAAGASPGGHELAAGGELLDAVVGGVVDVDEALVVDGDALRRVELPGPRSTPAPRVRHRPCLLYPSPSPRDLLLSCRRQRQMCIRDRSAT